MAVLSFVAMYALMYAMVDRRADVLSNLNQVYMAGLMTAPMVIIELLLMRHMFPRKRLNAALIAGAAIVGGVFFAAIRQQVGIGDGQFLQSMIPHHSAAILMCERANVRDAEIQGLCRDIIDGQKAEIAQMKEMLEARRSGRRITSRSPSDL